MRHTFATIVTSAVVGDEPDVDRVRQKTRFFVLENKNSRKENKHKKIIQMEGVEKIFGSRS